MRSNGLVDQGFAFLQPFDELTSVEAHKTRKP